MWNLGGAAPKVGRSCIADGALGVVMGGMTTAELERSFFGASSEVEWDGSAVGEVLTGGWGRSGFFVGIESYLGRRIWVFFERILELGMDKGWKAKMQKLTKIEKKWIVSG